MRIAFLENDDSTILLTFSIQKELLIISIKRFAIELCLILLLYTVKNCVYEVKVNDVFKHFVHYQMFNRNESQCLDFGRLGRKTCSS